MNIKRLKTRLRDKRTLILIVILIISAFLRLYNLNWDHGSYFHSDERNVMTQVDRVSLGDLNPHFFVYGAFPVYVNKLLLSLISIFVNINYQVLVLRFTSAMAALFTVLLVYLITSRIGNRDSGLIAAAMMGLAVLNIQSSHYGTVDNFLVCMTMAALYYAVQTRFKPEWKNYILTGIFVGLTLATKTSGIVLILPVFVMHILTLRRMKDIFRWRKLQRLVVLLVVAVAVSFIAAPYTYLDFEEFRKAMDYEGKVVIGEYIPSYTMVFRGTSPYIYQTQMLIKWGMGYGAGILGFLGFLFIMNKSAFFRREEEAILLAYAIPYFLIVGSWQVKFVRYMLPMVPFLCIFAGLMFYHLHRLCQQTGVSIKWLRWSYGLGIFMQILYTASFFTIYLQPNSRIEATRWFRENVPPGSVVLGESPWDDPIPMNIAGEPPHRMNIVTSLRYRSDYADLSAVIKERFINDEIIDDRDLDLLASKINEADYITLATKRLYGGLMKYPDHYWVSCNYYRLLFSGALGFDLVRVFTRYPALFGIELNDDFAEESFTTYDHPKILVFKKIKPLSKRIIKALIKNPPDEVANIERDYLISMNMDRFKTIEVNYSAYAVMEEIPKGKTLDQMELNQPRDIDCGEDGKLYVSDFRNNMVYIFDSENRLLNAWGGKGDMPGKFNDPCGICVDSKGNIYVADTWNYRVQKFDAKGEHILSIKDLYAPRAVETDKDDNLYIVESGNCSIHKYDTRGNLIAKWGTRGDGAGQFQEPIGITIGSDGRIYVCDTWNHRIQVFDSNGKYLMHWQVDLWQGDIFREPYIDIAPDGNILVTDPPGKQIFRYTPDGNKLDSFYMEQTSFKPLNYPMGIAVCPGGRVYISDTLNNRIIYANYD